MAEVHTTALIIEGNTETPERVKAMTNGDCCAVPVEMLREGSLDGLDSTTLDVISRAAGGKQTHTIIPTMRMLRT